MLPKLGNIQPCISPIEQTLYFDLENFQSSWILKEVHYNISNNKMHNNIFVQHVLTLHWGYLKNMGCYPILHVVWSNGCLAHFKCACAWYFVIQYPWLSICKERPEGVQMCSNCFASDQGKDEVNGASALLKCEICKKSNQNTSCQAIRCTWCYYLLSRMSK